MRQAGPRVQHRVHVSGGDTVDADAVAGPFGGERGFEREQGCLGGVVGGLGLGVVGAVGRDGGDEEDGAGGGDADLVSGRGVFLDEEVSCFFLGFWIVWEAGLDGRWGRKGSRYLLCDGLCAQKCSCGIDVQRLSPLFGSHLDGVHAADDARKTAENIHASKFLGHHVHRKPNVPFVDHIDVAGPNQHCWEVFAQKFDFCRCAALETNVEECEAGQAMFEECPGVDECERACTARD